MTEIDPRDVVIRSMSERLYICSRLLTCAAERLGWDTVQVKELIGQLKKTLVGEDNAGIEEG